MQMTCLREGPESAAWSAVKRTAGQLLESIAPLGQGTVSEREALNVQVRQSIADGLQLIGWRAEQGAPVLVKVQQLQQLRFTPVTSLKQQLEVPARPATLSNAGAVQPLIAGLPVSGGNPLAPGPRAAAMDGAEPAAPKPVATALVEIALAAEVAKLGVAVPVMPVEIAQSEPGLVGDLPDTKTTAWVQALHTGSWFELTIVVGEPAQRCKLAAIISFSSKYIFVNRNGMKVAEHSAISLAQYHARGLVRLLDDNQLFDRALESVIGNLRRLQASKN